MPEDTNGFTSVTKSNPIIEISKKISLFIAGTKIDNNDDCIMITGQSESLALSPAVVAPGTGRAIAEQFPDAQAI